MLFRSIRSSLALSIVCLSPSERGAGFLLRGLRSAADWEAEQNIAFVNRQLAPEVETVWLPAEDALVHVSSSNVREIWRNGGDASVFLPEGVELPKEEKK